MRIAFAVTLALGLALRLAYAVFFQGRVWIDELWVALNPAYALVSGKGFLNPADWVLGIRSWLPPALLSLPLRFMALLGVEDPMVVHSVLRSLIAIATWYGLLRFLQALAVRLKLRQPPLLAAAFVFFTPEFIRQSTSADLSTLGLPPLLLGLSAALRGAAPARIYPWLALSALLRYQYGVAAVGLAAFQLWGARGPRRRSLLAALAVSAAAALFIEFAFNGVMYGRPILPLWNYFHQNTAGGMAAGFGVTPFYFAFEILWRFMTEPAFIVAALTLPLALKRAPEAAWPALALAAAHVAVGHKEFRFFYGPAILLAALGGAGLQAWAQASKKRAPALALAAILFTVVAAWRGVRKVDWLAFEVPAALEEKAGAMPGLKGVLVCGWGGIHSGGNYTVLRPVPYFFAETCEGLRRTALDVALYDAFIAPQGVSDRPACGEPMARRHGAALYRCSREALEAWFHP